MREDYFNKDSFSIISITMTLVREVKTTYHFLGVKHIVMCLL